MITTVRFFSGLLLNGRIRRPAFHPIILSRIIPTILNFRRMTNRGIPNLKPNAPAVKICGMCSIPVKKN